MIITDIEKIRQEIKSELSLIKLDNDFDEGRWSEPNHLLLFIDNIEEKNDLIEATKEVLKDKDTARQFLLNAGIMDRDGNLAEPYRTEEPVSEELEEEISHQWMFQPKDSEGYVEISENDYTNIARHFANWQKQKTLKESEDAIQYVKQNHSPSEVSDFQNAMNISVMKAFDAGKEKMREQMMAKAFDAKVLENYDGKVIEYDETILDKKLSNCKVFDKVKVIVVKED